MTSKTRLLTLASLILPLILACKSKKNTPIDQKHDEIMAIHDEVMPKMKDIFKLRKRIKKIDGLDAEISKSVLTKLEEADDAMMDWMAQYKKPKAKDRSAMTYLEDQVQKVTEMKQLMLSAISTAEQTLADHE